MLSKTFLFKLKKETYVRLQRFLCRIFVMRENAFTIVPRALMFSHKVAYVAQVECLLSNALVHSSGTSPGATSKIKCLTAITLLYKTPCTVSKGMCPQGCICVWQ